MDNELVDSLGQDWKDINGMRVKACSSMGGTHSSIDCIIDLQKKHPARFSDIRYIRHIKVEQSIAFYSHGGQIISRPITVTGVHFTSLLFNLLTVASSFINSAPPIPTEIVSGT